MNEQATDQQAEKGEAKKGQGSFWISEEALNILIKNKATAWQIGAYLTLARFTDPSGKFSVASNNAIYEKTGASPGTAQKPGKSRQLLQELLKMRKETSPPPPVTQAPPAKRKGPKITEPAMGPARPAIKLLYEREDWQRETGESIPETPHVNYPVTWVLNDFGGKNWVWFPNELVDGHGRFRQPLWRLKQRCGDVAARLLLLLYNRNDMVEFGGIPPRLNVYRKYTLEHLLTAYECTFRRAVAGVQSFNDDLALPALGLRNWPIKEEKHNQKDVFYNALFSLLSQGFLAEVVTVMDRDPTHPDARPLYELHFKAKGFQIGPKENALAGRIDRIFSKLRIETMADKAGRFFDKFPVLSDRGTLPHVAGIYRPRFLIMNPKNYTVMSSWKRRVADRETMLELVNHLEKRLGIASELPDHPHQVQPDYQQGGIGI